MNLRLLAASVIALVGGTVSAQTDARVVVAKSTSPEATFSARPANGNQFRTLADKDDLFSGDLIVSLPGGSLVSKNGAVAVKSLPDFDLRSSLPIFETALSLADPKDLDLDVTLDRGRVDFTNTKSAGAANIRLRFANQTWRIVLDSPTTRVAVELCGRWPSGSRFKVDEKTAAPVASLVILVLSGTASVDVGGVTLALKAPPGPAELRWDSLAGARPQPLKLEKLPEWADPEVSLSDTGKKTAAAVEKFRKARVADPGKALETFLSSTDPAEQRVALVTLGALDELDALGKSLVSAKTLEQWDFGVTVIRHWLGRCKGQDQRYYELLTSARGYTPGQAKTIVQLLFGFSADDVSVPETYEVLIDYLVHEKPAIRNLAAWHLVRLVPQGKSIAYKPDGSRDEAAKSSAEWKKLIPAGQLPPPVKKP